jgi:hypothetical protein
MMKTPMGIAASNFTASDDESLLGARLRADCDQAGLQAAEEGNRPAATRASASDARSGQCLDSDPLPPVVNDRFRGALILRLGAALGA